MNWSQIFKEIYLSLVIMSYKELDGGEGGMGEKGGESQTSVTISLLPFPIIDVILSPIVLLLSESE